MEKRRKDAPAPEATAGFVPVGQSRTQAVGLFIEWRETQMVLIALILLDVAAATIGIMLDLQPKAIVPSFVVYALQSLSGFTQVLFVLEITALVWVFQLALFSHVGYCIDFGVVVFSLTWEFQRQSKAVRILGLLRLWRVFRLVETYLNDERVQHQATAALLEAEQQLTAKHALRIQILEDALEKEYQAKAQLNQVLQEYKDEIDTLKEALEIAALSVMQDKDDEEEEKEEEDIWYE